MLVSCVLRVLAEVLPEGRIAGEVQLVATGERFAIRDTEELLALLERAAATTTTATDTSFPERRGEP